MKDEIIPIEMRNLAPRELCALEGFGLSTLEKLDRMGMGPEWTIFPGIAIKRVTPQARREWHERIAQWRAENAARLEAERRKRSERMVVLGKMSTESPGHPSRKQQKKSRR
jgi:hypothetical protein